MIISTVPTITANLPNPHSYSHDSNLRKAIISLLHKNRKNPKHVQSIHCHAVKTRTSQDPFVAFELLRVYCKVNYIGHAIKLFRCIQNPNVYLYTSLIDGFVSFGSYPPLRLEELNYLTQFEGYLPTEVALHDIDDEQKE
ncbi:hypothetical protein AAZV13_16G133700 [Glycine max]